MSKVTVDALLVFLQMEYKIVPKWYLIRGLWVITGEFVFRYVYILVV